MSLPEPEKNIGCHVQVWDRRRHVPSQVYNDPLLHLFEEFDKDSDGHLTHLEIAEALQSNRFELCLPPCVPAVVLCQIEHVVCMSHVCHVCLFFVKAANPMRMCATRDPA